MVDIKRLEVKSSAFSNNTSIPQRYTCDGKDISPPLSIYGVPEDAKSLVLIVDDPDASGGGWDHWIVFDIDPGRVEIEEDIIPGTEALNSSDRKIYSGPCPPSGTHRYFFKVYALDMTLGLSEDSSRSDVENAMKGHVLAQGELIGLYARG